ncbi:MAG: hypothetical protein H0V60_05500 [Actinobacteria bacterium]|jgi:hypothetical protein|nr:hypothetical protein [Actinomycetota bacterium]
MIKALVSLIAGVAGALQMERWLGRQRLRWGATTVTGSVLDRLNRRLESERGAGRPPGPGGDPINN